MRTTSKRFNSSLSQTWTLNRFRHAPRYCITFLGAVFTLISTAGTEASAGEPPVIAVPQSWAALESNSASRVAEGSKIAFTPQSPANKSYAIPAAEIVGFDFLLNQYNRRHSSEYDSNLSTIKRNLQRSWVVDNDPFKVNQFLHPYQGSMYHGFARSAGLNYWESFGYTFAGSAFW